MGGMTGKALKSRLAVLIDGDNASPELADALFAQVAQHGRITIRRIYGDFLQPQLQAWAEAMIRHAIIPHQQGRNTPHKNATDIALVIDAMDVLHGGLVDGFCIVSSDGDFTRLAARIREHGLAVYGVGSTTAPESFRKACAEFVELPARPAAPKSNTVKPYPAPRPAPEAGHREPLLRLIHAAIAELPSEEGWFALAALGTQLAQQHPGYKDQVQGSKKLTNIVRATQAFDLEQRTGKGWWIRPALRPPATAAQ